MGENRLNIILMTLRCFLCIATDTNHKILQDNYNGIGHSRDFS